LFFIIWVFVLFIYLFIYFFGGNINQIHHEAPKKRKTKSKEKIKTQIDE